MRTLCCAHPQAWGAEDPVGDLDESGIVDGADLAILLQDWSG